MKYTIKDLREGRVYLLNDGTLEELKKVLNLAFPDDRTDVFLCKHQKFFKSMHGHTLWCFRNNNPERFPVQSVKDFLIEEDFKLPEKWCVKAKKGGDVHKWFEKKLNRTVNADPKGCYFHYPEVQLGNLCTSHFVENNHQEISLEQFKKYVMEKQWQPKNGELVEYRDASTNEWSKGFFVGARNSPVGTASKYVVENRRKYDIKFTNDIRETQEPKTVELTLEQIAEKFEINVEDLKIKK